MLTSNTLWNGKEIDLQKSKLPLVRGFEKIAKTDSHSSASKSGADMSEDFDWTKDSDDEEAKWLETNPRPEPKVGTTPKK